MTRPLPYLLALALIAAAALVALARTDGRSLALAPEPPTLVAETAPAWLAPAQTLWEARCAGCHAQLTYLPSLYLAEGGRRYLVDVMLYGVEGVVEIEGELVPLRHRPYADLADEELAGLLNLMITAWGNAEALPDAEPFEPDEVAQARERPMTREEVLEARPRPVAAP